MSSPLKFRRVRSKPKAHPLIRELIKKMNEHNVGVMELCAEANVGKSTFANWGNRSVPKVDVLEACYNVLGYELRPVQIGPKAIRGNVKEYTVTSSTGVKHHVVNLKQFCVEHQLNPAQMYEIADTPATYKGWRVRRGVE